MSLLFDNRPTTGAKDLKYGGRQKLSILLLNNLRQLVASLGALWRTPASSFMTIAVLGLSLTLPTILHVLVKNVQSISNNFDSASQITLFLKSNVTEQKSEGLLTRLNLYPEVQSTQFISKEEAMEEFKALSGFGRALNYLDENPLPAVILVTPSARHSQPAAAQQLLVKLQKEREVDLGKLDIEWLERLNAIVRLLEESVYTLAVLLLSAVLLIIGNTIRLSIMNKREEIEVMKLVGATEAFIQRPFLYTGIWYGFFGGFVAYLVVEIILWWIADAITKVASAYATTFTLAGLSLNEFGWLMLIAIGLGFCGSMISVKRYVSQIEPEML
ncbi:MAG: cell division transport system permease protein [Phenylobacterium sp.]|jgi:cell division transport system permease protein